MQIQPDEQIKIFKALSDANRLQIIDMLSCGELCACKLLAYFHITQPTLSHHMKILTDCGLVAARKEGVWMHYSLNKVRVEELIEFIQALTSDKEDCVCTGDVCCAKPPLHQAALRRGHGSLRAAPQAH